MNDENFPDGGHQLPCASEEVQPIKKIDKHETLLKDMQEKNLSGAVVVSLGITVWHHSAKLRDARQ